VSNSIYSLEVDNGELRYPSEASRRLLRWLSIEVPIGNHRFQSGNQHHEIQWGVKYFKSLRDGYHGSPIRFDCPTSTISAGSKLALNTIAFRIIVECSALQKGRFFVGLAVLCLFGILGCESSPMGSLSTLDLGRLPRMKRCELKIPLTNKSSRAVVLTGITASCSCGAP